MKKRMCSINALLLAVFLCGCSEADQLRFFTQHDQKAQAQQKWDAVRSNVKLQLVRQHLTAGRLDEAEKILEQALAAGLRDSRPYVLAAKLRLEQGRMAEARKAIITAIELPGAEVEAYYVCGVVAERYGDKETALAMYRAAAGAAPLVPAYLMAEAETLLSMDRPVEALEVLTKRLNDFDGNAALRVLAARIARGLELRGPAVAFARDAIQLARDDHRVILQVSEILEWAEADETLIAALSEYETKTNSTSVSVKCMLARAHRRAGMHDAATKMLRTIAAEDDKSGVGPMIAIRAALEQGDMAQAATAARSAVDGGQGGRSPDSLMVLGLSAMSAGRHAEAFELITRSLEIDPGNTAALCLKGQVCEALGRGEEAKWCYARALAIDPEIAIARYLLDNLRSGVSLRDPGEDKEPPAVQAAVMPAREVADPCAVDTEGQ